MRNPSMVSLKYVLNVLWRDVFSKRPSNLACSLRKEHCTRFCGMPLDILGKNTMLVADGAWRCNNSHLTWLPSQFILVNRMASTSLTLSMQLLGFSCMWKPVFSNNPKLQFVGTIHARFFWFLVPCQQSECLMRERNVCWLSRLEGKCLELGV